MEFHLMKSVVNGIFVVVGMDGDIRWGRDLNYPDSNTHGANIVLPAPGGSHVSPMNFC